jgi:hypothetical protein
MSRFAAILFMAWMAWAAQAQPVQPGELVETEVLSVRAPGGPGWALSARAPARVTFSRLGEGRNGTLAAMAIAFRIPVPGSRDEFMDLIRRGVAADTPAPRFRAISESFAHEEAAGASCVRYIALHEDLEARTFVAPQRPLQMQSHTRYCLHPKEPGVALAAGYSHRGERAPDTTDPEARAFIDGVSLRRR